MFILGKVCSKCKIFLNKKHFTFLEYSKDKLDYNCKECKKLIHSKQCEGRPILKRGRHKIFKQGIYYETHPQNEIQSVSAAHLKTFLECESVLI